jgi:hypothetical protein
MELSELQLSGYPAFKILLKYISSAKASKTSIYPISCGTEFPNFPDRTSPIFLGGF